MRIRLAILEQDSNYLKRITSVFDMRFADKLEVFAYTDREAAMTALKSSKIDVFLASDGYEIPVEELPGRCGFAYFVDELTLEEFRGQKTVCKFQQAENIYKQVLDLYAEKFQGVLGGNGDGKTNIWWFCSPGGGCGCSSAAASAAIHFARKSKKVLYLELEEFGDAGLYFYGSGKTDMNDVIFSVKGRKKNILLKLESNVRRDEQSGVYYFAAPPLALDMNELNEEDISVLLGEIRKSGTYDIVIINKKLSLNAFCRMLWKEVDRVTLVSDGSETGNSQLKRALDSMRILAGQKEEYWLEKLMLICNKFDNRTGSRPEEPDITFAGSIPLYEHATVAQVLQNASMLSVFDVL